VREPLAWREDLEWVRLESPMVWCWRCKALLPRDYFQPSQIQTETTGHCRRCHGTSVLDWQRRNPKKVRRYIRAWEIRNREKLNATRRERYGSNPKYRAAIIARNATWARANREKRNAYQREYYRRKKAEKEQA
jgi:hypothetical protein